MRPIDNSCLSAKTHAIDVLSLPIVIVDVEVIDKHLFPWLSKLYD